MNLKTMIQLESMAKYANCSDSVLSQYYLQLVKLHDEVEEEVDKFRVFKNLEYVKEIMEMRQIEDLGVLGLIYPSMK